MTVGMTVDGHEALTVTVGNAPANAGIAFEVPPTQQEVAEVNQFGVVTAKKPGVALVTARGADDLVIDQPIVLVRTSAQQQYQNDVHLGLRNVRTVFTPI